MIINVQSLQVFVVSTSQRHCYLSSDFYFPVSTIPVYADLAASEDALDDDDDDDDVDLCFTGMFVHKVGKMGRTTSKCNEAKSKMKQPSDMPTPRLNTP